MAVILVTEGLGDLHFVVALVTGLHGKTTLKHQITVKPMVNNVAAEHMPGIGGSPCKPIEPK